MHRRSVKTPTKAKRKTPIERLRRSFAMSDALRTQANLEARVDDPSAFYDRARARGLCDP